MKNSALRSLTLQQLSPLLNQADCVWFSLQKEPDPNKAPWVASGKLIDWAVELDDFDATAALAKNMDLIISVDTAVAHLAGGLGVPTWLFNRHASEWRWMRDREDSPWYPTLRIYTQKKSGDWDEVVSRMVTALGGKTTEPIGVTQAERDRLVALFDAGQHTQLESHVRGLLEQYPADGYLWRLLGVSLQTQGKDGLQALKKAIECTPDDAMSHNSLGNALKGRGQLDGAVACYRRATELNPDFFVAYNNLGVTLLDQGKLIEAEQSYRRALEIKPDYAEAHNNLGNVLRYQNRYMDAETHYLRALELKPDYADAHSNMGVILNNLGRLDEVVVSFRRALELKPGYADAHSNLGLLLQERGEVDAAMRNYARALEIRPDHADALHYSGLVLLGQGNPAEAAKLMSRAY